MAPRTVTDVPWISIIVSSLIAGTVSGVLFHFQLFILPFFGALIGIPTEIGGAIVHTIGSVLFIFLFASLLIQPRVASIVTTPWRVIGAGMVYGVLLFLTAFGLLLPALTRIRPVRPLSIPYLPLDGFILHLLFGLVIGLAFAFTWDPRRESVP